MGDTLLSCRLPGTEPQCCKVGTPPVWIVRDHSRSAVQLFAALCGMSLRLLLTDKTLTWFRC